MSASGGSVGTDVLLTIPPDYFTVPTEDSEGIENDKTFSDGVYILNDLLSEKFRDSFRGINLLSFNSSLTTKSGANKAIPQDDAINKSYIHNNVKKNIHESATEETHKINFSSSCEIPKGKYSISVPGSPTGTIKSYSNGPDNSVSNENSEDLQHCAPISEITSIDNSSSKRADAVMNDSNHHAAGHETINDNNMKQELLKNVSKNSDEVHKQDRNENTPMAVAKEIEEDNYIMMKYLKDEIQRINSMHLDSELQTSDSLKYDLHEADSLQKKMENARLQIEEALNRLEKKACTANDAYRNDLTCQFMDSVNLLGDPDITHITTEYSSPRVQPTDYILQFRSGGTRGAEGEHLSAVITESSVLHEPHNNRPNEKWNSRDLQGLPHMWAKNITINTEDPSIEKQKLEKEPYRRQEKQLLQDAYEELKKTQKRVSELETELTALQDQKDMITMKFMEEQKRVSVLEQQNSTMEQALRLAMNKEKSSNTETVNYEERLKAARNEIRLCCQSQLQAIINEKGEEFEKKLVAAKTILKAELETSKTQLLENAGSQCKMFADRHKRKITEMNEEFKKEMKEMELKLADSEHKRITAEKNLKEETNRRIEVAERLHSVMEKQWKETLKIITNLNSRENNKRDPSNNKISETTEKRPEKSYEVAQSDSSHESSSSATFYDDDILPIRKLNTEHANETVLNNEIRLVGLTKPRSNTLTSTSGTVDVPFTREVATRLANTQQERVTPDLNRNTHMLLETPSELRLLPVDKKSETKMTKKYIGDAIYSDVQHLKWEELLKFSERPSVSLVVNKSGNKMSKKCKGNARHKDV